MQKGRTQSQERRASAIMFLKSDLIFGLLLLSLVNHGNAGAAAEIGLIKKLLTTIFDRFEQLGKVLNLARYKSDMASLQEVVELTTGDLRR